MPQAAERPFEGRERELDSLTERWQRALEGAGQIATVSAAPGVGKSRLLEVFVDRTAGEARALLVCRCSKLRRFTAFSPFIDLLLRLEGARPAEGRIRSQVGTAGPDAGRPAGAADPKERLRATLIARLTALLAPRPQRRTAALNLNPEGRARKTLEELLGLFSEGAKRLPVLLVIEDLDWADPSTLALLEHLAQRRLHVRWMTVLTFTPQFEAPWAHRAHVVDLELPRLTHQQAEALLERLTAGRPLDPALRREIIARADGVPLFLEQQAQLIQQLEGEPTAAGDADGDRGQSRILPAILEHWLSACLGRLGAAVEVTHSAAIIGEELSRAQLAALSALDAARLERALDQLVEAGILVRPGAVTELAFSHVLIREAIHTSMAESPRRDAHRQMAELLSGSAVETVSRRARGALADQDLERIAYHYSEAAMPIEAASSWRQAADHAVRTSANLEAAERARQGLECLDSIADAEQRRPLEIELQIVLGAALGTAKGFAAADAVAAYDQALELVWQAPRAADHFQALQELASYYLSRGHVSTASEAAAKALRGLDHSDVEAMPVAQRCVGFAKLLQGDFTGAETALEKSLVPFAAHRSQLHAMPPTLAIPMAEKLSHLSLIEWFLGRPSRALKQSTDSLTLARRCNDPYSRVFTVFRASYLHVFRREPAATRELAHELVGLANRHGYLFFIAAGMFLEGQALAAQGRAAEGLQMMSGGLDGVWASGMEVGRPRNLALLAEACGRSELYEQGLSLIKEGIAAVAVTGEGHYEAELHRIQGELLRHSGGDEAEIEESCLEALGVARRQGSAALELRSAISLSRLRRAQDKMRQARELLAEVYARFDEGFDTADLKEAKELLDELS